MPRFSSRLPRIVGHSLILLVCGRAWLQAISPLQAAKLMPALMLVARITLLPMCRAGGRAAVTGGSVAGRIARGERLLGRLLHLALARRVLDIDAAAALVHV